MKKFFFSFLTIVNVFFLFQPFIFLTLNLILAIILLILIIKNQYYVFLIYLIIVLLPSIIVIIGLSNQPFIYEYKINGLLLLDYFFLFHHYYYIFCIFFTFSINILFYSKKLSPNSLK